ncbi:MAG: GAF domain-containing protein [Anaerolineaceae bacterium]|nr:GAF domain-containing protein [Anaerolineaceae bacterium]
MKIRKKIAFFQSILVSLVIASLFVSILSARATSKTQVENHLLASAHSRANHVNTLLNDYQQTVQLLAVGVPVVNVLDPQIDYSSRIADINRRINSSIEAFPGISRIRILDENGIVIASSHEDVGFDRSEKDIFLQGKEGIYVGEIHISEYTGDLVLSISAPVYVRGNFSGVLIINFDLENDLYPITTDSTGLGETGEIYLADKNGTLISPLKNDGFAILKSEINTEQVEYCLTEHLEKDLPEDMEDLSLEYKNYAGESVLGVHSYISVTQWCMIAESAISEAYNPIREKAFVLFAIFSVLLLLLILFSAIATRTIVFPILKLQKGTQEIINGNLDFNVGIESKDEIGQLSHSFDLMTGNLRKTQAELSSYTDTLELQVNQRTGELEKQVNNSEKQRIATLVILNDLNQATKELKMEIIERVHAENALQRYTLQLETLNTVTAALSKTLELDKVLELILDQIGQVLPFNSGAIFLHEKDGLRVVMDRGINPSVKGRVFPIENELFEEIQRTKIPLVLDNVKEDPRFQNFGQSGNVASWMGVPLIVRDTMIGHLTFDNDSPGTYSSEQADLARIFASQAAQAIENARQYNDAQRRMEWLNTLHKIDQAITSSFNLENPLEVMLDHLLVQLEVDAAAVLRYEKDIQVLTFSQGQGFRTTALKYTNLRLGEGHAGKVALQRQPLFVPDMDKPEKSLLESPGFQEEGFVAYYGVPLITKGELMGVLEIFHRSALSPNDEWVNYLHVLAEQAAIAIENSTMFNDLQNTNVKLVQAYDATIEGWARALEMRDMETEGHSRRVVDLTINLAQCLEVRGEKLVHIRRGALLHDIGKMAVPDTILQKPEELNDEEWRIMRQHPVSAYEWLSPIEYLQPALNIPYCHHEKWDGSGYPRGLRVEQIPLEARIFAVVDVWDALQSDRPYRKAWPRKKTLTYIQEQSGKHFDPKVVVAFIKYLTEGGDIR